jgi:hypothetical protein
LLKENTLVAVEARRLQAPIGVLLGGTGRARPLPMALPKLSALLKPLCRAYGSIQMEVRPDEERREDANEDSLSREQPLRGIPCPPRDGLAVAGHASGLRA